MTCVRCRRGQRLPRSLRAWPGLIPARSPGDGQGCGELETSPDVVSLGQGLMPPGG